MKRSFFLLVLLVCVIVVLTLCLVMAIRHFGDSPKSEPENEPLKSVIRYSVSSGEITHTVKLDGKVIPLDQNSYISTINLNLSGKQDFCLYADIGDNIEKGDLVYSLNDEKYISEFNARVADINKNEKQVVITLLNYEVLCATAKISQFLVEKITVDTPVTVSFNGNDYESKILKIGYEVNNGEVEIMADIPDKYLPGTDITITVTTDKVDRGVYVNADAVFFDGDKYYGYIETDDGSVLRELAIGEFFTVKENDTEYAYYEILSGLSVDDILVVEQYE